MPKNNMNESGSNQKNPTTSSVNNNGTDTSSTGNSYSAARNNQKQQEQDSNKKAAKVAAKGAATYFAGPEGAVVVDKLAQTKAGNEILNKGGEILGKIPGMSKATKKLDEKGALDAGDKALSFAGGGASAGGAGAASGAAGGTTASYGAAAKVEGNVQNPNAKAGGDAAEKSSMGGTGGPGKSGGLGRPSSLDEANSAKDDGNESDSESKSKSDFLSDFTGFGFLPGKTKIIIGACFLLFLFMGFGIFSVIGSSDEDDAKNGKGNPDSEGAKGTKYEVKGSNMSTGGGACTYDIKGATNGQTSTSFNQQISDIKVRLMHASYCDGTDNVPIEGEELVDFETYILGIVYAEISGGSNKAHAQTQAVAARSFILDRAIRGVNKSSGVKLINENGQWILQVRNCVADQVFCNPDKGCSKRGDPGNQMLDVYSGVNKPITYKGPLSQSSKSRQWVAETSGQVLVNKHGYIVGTNYAGTLQDKWATQGKTLDYKQILLQTYGSNKDIYTASCTASTSTGDYTSWKQYGAPWSSVSLGNSSATIQSAGCLATSISMLIAKSGVTTKVSGTFDPGTFVQSLSSNGGFDNNGNLQWNAVSRTAPSFVYQNSQKILNSSKSSKLNTIKSLLNQGYYVVAEVKGNTGQHWVAVDSVNGDTINMFDPGSTSTNMWSQYNWKNTSRVVWFSAS